MNDLARARYVEDSIATASPARLLVMLYDRLLLDLERAEQALRDADAAAAGPHIGHAQEIVFELRASLRVDEWDGGRPLASVYGFVVAELLRALMERSPERVASCTRLLEPLADAWRQAALATVPAAPVDALA